MKKIYYYPKKSNSNRYVFNMTALLASLGYEVRDIRLKSWKLLRDRHDKAGEILILNWFEDQPSYSKRPMSKCIRLCVFLIISRLVFGKLVWVQHNFRPHNGKATIYFRVLCSLLSRLCDHKVMHRPVDGVEMVVPHPLYERKELQESSINRDIEFLYFGRIERYKGIYELLSNWPKNIKLTLRGKSSDLELKNDIEKLLEERELQVDYVDKFLTDSELNSLISRSQFVVIPHQDKTMAVSGTFFHAISFGANVLIREGEFSLFCKSVGLNFVSEFSPENLGNVLVGMSCVSPEQVFEQSEKYFGSSAASKAWIEVLGK